MTRYRILLMVWLVSDVLLFLGSHAIAYFVRIGWMFSTNLPFSAYMGVAALVAPVWLSGLIVTRTFALTRSQTSFKNLVYIVSACVMGSAAFALGYYFLFKIPFSRLLLLLGMLLSAAAAVSWHIAFGRIVRTMLRRDPPAFPTLIIGATREAGRLIELLNRTRNPLKPVAILDGHGTKEKEIAGVPVRGKLNLLEETLARERITHLVQCADLEHTINLLSACRQRGITYLLLPSVLGIVERDEAVEPLEGQPVTMVRSKGPGWEWFFR